MPCFRMSFRVRSLVLLGLIAFLPFAALQRAEALETASRHAVLIDTATGAVLFEKDADVLMPPASMSKLMTIYMVFERLKEGSLSLEDVFSVSENAWRKGGAKSGSSTMFLEPGSRVTVEDLLKGIVIQSGNDACIVIAEGLSGSEEAFAQEMTEKGRKLGLRNSTFRNSTGWPNPDHLTTAKDLALLAQVTIENFPEYYHYYAGKSFTYNGIKQGNRNPLLYRDMGADGLKTGHTQAAGYGLTASAKRGDRRLILVVNGLPSVKARTRESERLLEWGFREFNNYALFQAGETVVDAEVWLGETPTVPLVANEDVIATLPRKARREMKVTATFEGPIPAPIVAGDQIAKLVVTAPGSEALEVPLYAGADVGQLGVFGRLLAALKHIVWGSSG